MTLRSFLLALAFAISPTLPQGVPGSTVDGSQDVLPENSDQTCFDIPFYGEYCID